MFKKILKGVKFLFIETIIPFSLSFWIFSNLYEWFKLWKLGTSFWFYFILFTVVVGGSMVFSVALDQIIKWQSTFRKQPKSKPRLSKVQKRLRFFLANVLLPLLIALTVALLPISGDTVLTRFIRYLSTRGEYYFLESISDSVVHAGNVETKIAGIETLKTIHSKKCLLELFRILKNDVENLNDEYFYEELSQSIASFEVTAIPRLLKLFEESEKAISKNPSNQPDLFTRYFESSFKRLNEDVKNLSQKQETKQEIQLRLQELELNVKRNLKDAEIIAPDILKENSVIDFVFSVFLKMEELKDNQQIYNLARMCLANTSMSIETRVKALLLIGKLGSEKDFKTLVSFLTHDSEEIKAAALEAIGILHIKIVGQQKKENM